MKKIALLILILTLNASLFAGNGAIGKYAPYPRDYRAMGEAGLSLKGSERGFFVNPASLSTKKFSLVLPSLEIGVGSISDIIDIPFSDLEKMDAGALDQTLGKISGVMPLVMAKAAVSTDIFGLGAAFDSSLGVFASGEGFSAGIVPFLKLAGTLGYGHSFALSERLDLEVGVAAHSNFFFYSSPLSVSSAASVLTDGLGGNVSMNLSSANLTFDAGTTIRSKNGLSFGLVLSGMGDDLEMKDMVTESEFTLERKPSLDVGLGWERVFWNWLGVKAALDVKDLTGLFSSFSFPSFLYHSNMGLGINFTKGLGLMCGLKGGFPSFGVDIKLFFLDVFVLYTVDEYSEKVGYNPRDTLSLVARIAF